MSSLDNQPTRQQPSVGDIEEEITLDLIPDKVTTGALRQSALEDVAVYKSSGFKVTFLQKHVVHGFYDGDSSDPASLLVFEVWLTGHDKSYKRRIRNLKASLRFEADPLKQPMHDPFLISWEPAMRGALFIHSSNVSYTNESENKVSLSAKKEPVPLQATVEHGNKKGKQFDRDDKAVCTADVSRTETRGGGRKGRDEVEWRITENKSQKLLPDGFGIAVVVKRTAELNFRIIFDVEVEVDFWYDLTATFEKAKDILSFKGRRELSKSYDVGSQGIIPEGVEKSNLKALIDRDGLDQFMFFHEPEEIASAKHYSRRAEEKSTNQPEGSTGVA